MQVAILCGGLATRLGPLAKSTPKSMIKINGRPFLEYQLNSLKENGIKDVVLCVGHLKEQIESYFGNGSNLGVRIQYSREEGLLLGTAGALKQAAPLLEDPFFVLYGDSYVFLDYKSVVKRMEEFKKLCVMVVYKNDNAIESSNVDTDGLFVNEHSKGQHLADFKYIDYGVSLFRKKALELIPENQFFSLTPLFQKLIARRELLSYQTFVRYFQIGTLKGLVEFKDLIDGRYEGVYKGVHL